MPDKADLVHVEIFGQTYSVKAGGDPAYVEKLAASVDQQMKEVSRASGAVDSLRVAVLTGAGGTFCSGMDLKGFLRGESQ